MRNFQTKKSYHKQNVRIFWGFAQRPCGNGTVLTNAESTRCSLHGFCLQKEGEPMQPILRTIFWSVYELLLLGALCVLILRVRAVWRALQDLEKRYALAPETIPAGHTVRKTRAEIRPALRRCRTEFFSWTAVAAVTSYAVLDCFVFNILMR